MDSEPFDGSDDDISGPDSADDSDPEKLESKEKKVKKMDAFLDKADDYIAEKLENGEITAEEAIVARNRLDLEYRKNFNRMLKEVETIKKRRNNASILENRENQEYQDNLDNQERREANLAKLFEITKNDKKQELEPANTEGSTSELEAKKAKSSEEVPKSSEELPKSPKDGLSPVD
jgi:hypothetical protein